MATVSITSIAYDGDANLLSLACDFTALPLMDTVHAPGLVVMRPEAIGNRIDDDRFTDGAAALDAIVLEHAARLAPSATDTTVVWHSPSDEEKASHLDALADRIAAARVFFAAD